MLILLGTVLLILPISSAAGQWTAPLTAFFTATSAVCVTGLVIADTGTYWSPIGQAIILGLIQIGGFGFMTGSTLVLFLLLVGRRTGLRDRVLVQATTDTPNLGSVTTVVKRVALFTVIVEVAGIAILVTAFLAHGDPPLRALTNGVFHAISAFNNAGFDLMGDFEALPTTRRTHLCCCRSPDSSSSAPWASRSSVTSSPNVAGTASPWRPRSSC